VTFEVRLASIRNDRLDRDSLADLARLALDAGEEERALPLLERAARGALDARLWQWTGLLQRALDRHEGALQSFGQAAKLAPSDVSIARGHAQVTFEAGLDATALFERACRLAPTAGDVVLGLAAARLAVGRGEEAAAALDAILVQSPLWLEGHMQLAQLRSMLGQPDAVETSLARALAARPGESALWDALFNLRLRSEDYAALADRVKVAEKAGQTVAFCAEYKAIAVAELGDDEHADALFNALPAAVEPRLAIWRIRHLLRSGRAELASRLIDDELKTERASAIWPYAATAWRLTGDPRGEWLESDPRFVTVMDLEQDLPPLDRLAALLRSLHVAKGAYLDQSVRGGTQTDGPLLSRMEPLVRAARDVITRAVARYIAQLPPRDPSHPLLACRRDRTVRFAGSWSVRLAAGGLHSNHVHPQGWISSALYVVLPHRQTDEDPHAGWLALGEPPTALGLDLLPRRIIEPREGRLILFPSWMWHGTRPFSKGERLTIAFDVAPPR
jgi:tetratricopeptide (TPR) repeat protein